MGRTGSVLAAAVVLAASSAGAGLTAGKPAGPAAYTADGKMILPPDYRTWVYLTSGLDMSYTEGPAPQASTFDNVFVDPAAYAAFQRTGTWPDGAVMVLELRAAQAKGSINKAGKFQAGAVRATEMHVKDTARFKDQGGWAFFGFRGDSQPAAMIPASADCYACHRAHAAVDTTFVQFYPTLLSRAQAMKTLSPAYLAEEAAAGAAAPPHP
jgi:hypothetical protein